MAFNTISTIGLAIAFAGMCLCQQQQSANGASSAQYQSAVSQASFQTGSAAVQPQTKLEDIERDSLSSALALQKTAAQQSGKPSAVASPQLQQAYLAAAAPQQQYYVQQQQQLPSYQTAQQTPFYVQPYQAAQQPQYLAQPYQMAFDYAGVQYMIINPNGYNPAANQVYQPYYVSALPQPSAVPQYVTKSAAPSSAPASANSNAATTAAPAAAQQAEYKQQQQFAAPAAAAVQAQQEYKYVIPAAAPAYQYVQQQAAATPAGSGAVDFSYLTRHPAAPSAQFKAPAASAHPQYVQYTVPQQQPQYQQLPQQFYYSSSPFAGQAQQGAEQQPRGQHLSAKSQFSSGVKSTTPTPYKETFAYKFESTPSQQQQQQQSGATYSTLRFSA